LTFFCYAAIANETTTLKPIQNFDPDRYMGTWYEIARLDHWFERNQEEVQITYSFDEDGDIRIQTQCIEEGEPQESNGWAKFTDERSVGSLKISFFRPFYTPYLIFELDKNYQYAFLGSEDKKYLWFLARKKNISKALRNKFLQRTQKLGFKLDTLIWVKHSL